jgi:hypothetical protein
VRKLSAFGTISGLSRRIFSMSGWPRMAIGAPSTLSNKPSIAASVTV